MQGITQPHATRCKVPQPLQRLTPRAWHAACKAVPRADDLPAAAVAPLPAAASQAACNEPAACSAAGGLARRSLLMTAASCAAVASTTAAAGAATTNSLRPFCGVVNAPPSWSYSVDWQEGTIQYAGFQTWYRMLGKVPGKARKARSLTGTQEPTRLPLLVLHGGPGLPSRYLESLELLGVTNRRLVFYDQVGCGQSRRASGGKGPGYSRITPELFLEEIDAVRKALSLERMHVVGHGWGGMLALAYLMQQPASEQAEVDPLKGVATLTLLATPPSWQALVQDRRDKAEALGLDVWSALQQEDVSDTYQAALRAYEQAHVYCSQPVTPGCLAVSRATASPSISKAMTGGTLFQVGGKLAEWQLPGNRAGALTGLPTLVVRGSQEELSPSSTDSLMKGPLQAASTRLLELQGAGTMLHIDKHEQLLEAMEEHMAAHDA